jgi:serine/threonine protein kinase
VALRLGWRLATREPPPCCPEELPGLDFAARSVGLRERGVDGTVLGGSGAEGALAVPADESDSLERGTLVGGSYRILGKRAAGGMGEIYLASHTRCPGRFAVKVLPSRLREDARALVRFGEEAKLLGLIQHANVVRLLDFDTRGAHGPFLAMEYVEGLDLAHHIAERGLFSPQRAGQMVAQIAAALEAAHARRIVHGDIKPGNVMLTDGRSRSSR